VDDRGKILFRRAIDQRRANASTTKMVTGLVVSGATDPSEQVVVSAEAAATGFGGIDLQPGTRYTVDALLHALLMTSSNDAAVALAEHVSGTEHAFVERMNRLANRLGADDTHFVTSHGLDTLDHYSSARDLALIGRRLLALPDLARIVATSRATIEGPGGPEAVVNRNLLLESYRGAIGIKTGYTGMAGNVLVAAARRSGRTLVSVAMGSVDATADARALLDYGWARLRRTVVLPGGTGVGGVVWPFGGATGIIASAPVRGLARPETLRLSFQGVESDHEINAGDPLGRIVVTSGARRLGAVTAVASDTVTVDRTPWPARLAASLLRVTARVVGEL
jgi:serine-type D-Ala-D-Ala carboxypeptidase (penicillin-binding protein 5/6)